MISFKNKPKKAAKVIKNDVTVNYIDQNGKISAKQVKGSFQITKLPKLFIDNDDEAQINHYIYMNGEFQLVAFNQPGNNKKNNIPKHTNVVFFSENISQKLKISVYDYYFMLYPKKLEKEIKSKSLMNKNVISNITKYLSINLTDYQQLLCIFCILDKDIQLKTQILNAIQKMSNITLKFSINSTSLLL